MGCTGPKGCRCNEPTETAADVNDQHIRDINAGRETMRSWEDEFNDDQARELGLLDEKIDGPAHYGGKDNPYEAIKIIEAHNLGFHLGNCVKYILRAGKKLETTELKDLEKARWYINRRINQITGG